MATLASQQIAPAGIIPTLAAANSGGDAFVCGANSFLHVKNGSGSSITVTLVTPNSDFGQAIADVTITVAAGAEKLVGPLYPAEFENDSTGLGSITYSAATTVTVGVFTIPNVS